MNTITSCNPEKTIKQSSSSWGRLGGGRGGRGEGRGALSKVNNCQNEVQRLQVSTAPQCH